MRTTRKPARREEAGREVIDNVLESAGLRELDRCERGLGDQVEQLGLAVDVAVHRGRRQPQLGRK